MADLNQLGAVVIGRNEGDRFKRCLRSLKAVTDKIVYVDSGSTDGSPEFASGIGVEVVSLDMSRPFSAGRARNEGFAHLLHVYPEVRWVQFVDGDCELLQPWVSVAVDFLAANDGYAVACGRRLEKFPDASMYNQLCHIEWNTPVGEAKACGGDFIARTDAFQDVDGFNPSVIAGEEPEMCFRLRSRGYKIMRLEQDMTLHDAQMTSVKQWWLRAKRCGHAYAQGANLHGDSEELYYRREVRSALLWGCIIPIAPIIGLVLVILGAPIWVFGGSLIPGAVLAAKIFKYARTKMRLRLKTAFLFSGFVAMAKLPELVGVLTFKSRARSHRDMEIIEYK